MKFFLGISFFFRKLVRFIGVFWMVVFFFVWSMIWNMVNEVFVLFR